MARLTHMIRDITVETFSNSAASEGLRELYEAMQSVLLPGLSVGEFADMFAQTLAYGLFAARCNHKGPAQFDRLTAAREIPRTNPFLRRLFGLIETPDMADAPFGGFVDDLAHLLAWADMDTILADFGKATRQQDPMVHFYETFLTAYDPKLRELRGVYYTPEPVVSYIVRSVDAVLKRDFSCPDGLADTSKTTRFRHGPDGEKVATSVPRVLMLDPATGTGTFLYKVIELVRERFRRTNNEGAWPAYVQQQLLPRLFGFELLMASYAMAHLKLGMELAALDLPESDRASLAYDAEQSAERLGVYLTNTLDMRARLEHRLALAGFISDEANAALDVKRDEPVMVVLGNPPYSGHSANKGEWITRLLRGEELIYEENKAARGIPTDSYFMVDGKPLGERNPKWLNDDYVKFIRFAQWRIQRTGAGILAFITNHGYLDNPTFRGMRQSLMRSFDKIYVLDLHGNSKKKERTPGGGADENVFDIQQGVAIGIFVRRPGALGQPRHAVVHHAHLYGIRDAKYAYLAEQDVATTRWTTLGPQAPFYFFKPRDPNLDGEYQQGWGINDAMPTNVLGVTTSRDDFAIGFTEDELRARLVGFLDPHKSDDEVKQQYLAARDNLPIGSVRKSLRTQPWQRSIKSCLYRPFDSRYIAYLPQMLERPRSEVMRHMHAGKNWALATTRNIEIPRGWEHVFCTNHLMQLHTVSLKEVNYLCPLYLYPATGQLPGMDERTDAPGGRRANLAPAFIADFTRRLGMTWVPDGKGDRTRTVGPEDIFNYMYAIFHSPTYRERYAEMLKEDFPRVPLTDAPDLFRDLCALGDRLVALHLMEQRGERLTTFPIRGDNSVSKVRYAEPGEGGAERGRVYINNTQYFDGVAPEVWEFHVGGYQVCEKWLKDRKSRVLTYDDLDHYHNIVAALAETIRLMDDIDEAIEEHGGWPLAGSAATSPASGS